MFPENLMFYGIQHRTTFINEAARLIFFIDNELQSKKNGTSGTNFRPVPGSEPIGTKLELFDGRFKAFMRFTCCIMRLKGFVVYIDFQLVVSYPIPMQALKQELLFSMLSLNIN